MAEGGLGQRKVSGKMSLLSCHPEKSFVTLPEIGSPWDVQRKAQERMSSLSEEFPAPRGGGQGLPLCWLLQPALKQHGEAFVIKVLKRRGLVSGPPPDSS